MVRIMFLPIGPKKPKISLTIELVPETAWYSNVRSNVSHAQWDIIRKRVYSFAHHICEICGGVGSTWPVECHEVWIYDDKKHTQTLDKMIALCPACHEVKHIGLAQVRGRYEEAVKHLAKVNGISIIKAENLVGDAFSLWKKRSQHEWKLDISHLKEYDL
jgi:hypothetical protein